MAGLDIEYREIVKVKWGRPLPMIEVTKMSGERVFVNADHIESVEAQPDTVLVLTNGKHILVREAVGEVIGRILAYQQLVRSGLSAADPDRKRPGTKDKDED